MKGTCTASVLPPLLDSATGEMEQSDKAKADLLNKYFCSISSVNDSDIDPPTLPLRANNNLTDINVTEDDAKDVLKNLKTGKACGSDNISHQMLKGTPNSISIYRSLSKIFNQSIETCRYSSQWKLARVVPFLKKDDKYNPSNYRPISLLICVGKVMERVVLYKYIYNHIIDNSLLYPYQSGFLQGHSTVYQKVCNNVDNRLSNI